MSKALPPPEWVTKGLCAQTDPDMFVPTEQGRTAAPARRVCASCPVKNECLEWALTTQPFPDGIYGGTTTRERVRMRRQSQQVAA